MARGNGRARGADAWDAALATAKDIAKRASIYVRLEDDEDTVVGAFVGDPRIREVHWTGQTYVDCGGSDCRACRKGSRKSVKVMVCFYVRDECRMKVVEGGIGWFKLVCRATKKLGRELWWYQIERVGQKGDPKTTYSITPEEEITDSEMAEIRATNILDLSHIGSEDFPQDEDDEPAPRRSQKTNREPERPTSRRRRQPETISHTDVAALRQRLREIDDDAEQNLLQDFTLVRLGDLPTTKLVEAHDWIDNEADEAESDDTATPAQSERATTAPPAHQMEKNGERTARLFPTDRNPASVQRKPLEGDDDPFTAMSATRATTATPAPTTTATTAPPAQGPAAGGDFDPWA
ncbi:MAG: hypothetical protein Q8R92_21195 [Deltaproteobacteria bacterium]|nr:hypothetical protein [Deltaproteobacteria bacterium]